jgi:hypothetical protein
MRYFSLGMGMFSYLRVTSWGSYRERGKGSQPFGCGPRLAVWYNLWLDLELTGRLSKGLNKLPM